MKCEKIMKRDVECVSPTETVEVAARRMRDQNLGFLPVCDSSKKALGTLTDRDLAIRVLASGKPANTPVEDVMTREVVACRPSDDIEKAEQLMAKNQKSRMMCIDDQGHVVGVISLSDIAHHEKGPKAAETLRKVAEREVRS
jgi:CBS domain-containing protein